MVDIFNVINFINMLECIKFFKDNNIKLSIN